MPSAGESTTTITSHIMFTSVDLITTVSWVLKHLAIAQISHHWFTPALASTEKKRASDKHTKKNEKRKNEKSYIPPQAADVFRGLPELIMRLTCCVWHQLVCAPSFRFHQEWQKFPGGRIIIRWKKPSPLKVAGLQCGDSSVLGVPAICRSHQY